MTQPGRWSISPACGPPALGFPGASLPGIPLVSDEKLLILRPQLRRHLLPESLPSCVFLEPTKIYFVCLLLHCFSLTIISTRVRTISPVIDQSLT